MVETRSVSDGLINLVQQKVAEDRIQTQISVLIL